MTPSFDAENPLSLSLDKAMAVTGCRCFTRTLKPSLGSGGKTLAARSLRFVPLSSSCFLCRISATRLPTSSSSSSSSSPFFAASITLFTNFFAIRTFLSPAVSSSLPSSSPSSSTPPPSAAKPSSSLSSLSMSSSRPPRRRLGSDSKKGSSSPPPPRREPGRGFGRDARLRGRGAMVGGEGGGAR
uniref:Uncharacterized protein n=1 Tax=Arundo donax TaxID=35708 RepID=A0A0A9HJ75_ARUDO